MVLSVNTRLELSERATELPPEADTRLKLVQRRYNKDYDGRIRLASILQGGDYVFLDRPPIVSLAAERSATEEYNKLLARRKKPYRETIVSQNTLHIVYNVLENTISIHWVTFSPASRRQCDDDQTEKMNKTHGEALGETGNFSSVKEKTKTSTLSTRLSDTLDCVPSLLCRATAWIQ